MIILWDLTGPAMTPFDHSFMGEQVPPAATSNVGAGAEVFVLCLVPAAGVCGMITRLILS